MNLIEKRKKVLGGTLSLKMIEENLSAGVKNDLFIDFSYCENKELTSYMSSS